MESAGVTRNARVTGVEFVGYIGTGHTGANEGFAITPRTYAVLYDADTPDFVIVAEVTQRFAGSAKEWITVTATPHTVVHMGYRVATLWGEEQLFLAHNECTFIWSDREGWPVGIRWCASWWRPLAHCSRATRRSRGRERAWYTTTGAPSCGSTGSSLTRSTAPRARWPAGTTTISSAPRRAGGSPIVVLSPRGLTETHALSGVGERHGVDGAPPLPFHVPAVQPGDIVELLKQVGNE
ncbi:unannotated protein [freshwater metagenome]|uniref:Unannotated protein n=1 Tax=freshwater metagenome TaxID=449393 RepID=A0A6J6SP10_9ZZZZ